MIKPQELQPSSRVDQVTSAIRQAILNGELKPGSPFATTELAAALGVSIIPVREALQRLSLQGLVELRPAKAAMVTALSKDDLSEIYHLRALIEGDLAERGCGELTVADVAVLESAIERMRGQEPGDEEFWDTHALFHRTLVKPQMTGRLKGILEPLWQGAQRYVRLIYDEVGFQNHLAPEETHSQLLETARRAEPVALREALVEHYETNLSWMLSGLARTTENRAK